MPIAGARESTYTVCMRTDKNADDTDRNKRRQENLRKRFVRETEQLLIAAVEGF